MSNISGFDELARTFEEAQKAIGSLDGEIGQVSFDPEDPSSIEAAILSINSMIDARVEGYEGNPLVEPLVDGMKETYRDEILKRAAVLREAGDQSE